MTFDTKSQVEHWWRSAEEELEFVTYAVQWKRTRHSMFHVHLTLELALKAAVCKATADVPPKIHDLIRLAELADLQLNDQQRLFLGRVNKFSITGRYTDPKPVEPDHEEADLLTRNGIEFLEWLKLQLFKV